MTFLGRKPHGKLRGEVVTDRVNRLTQGRLAGPRVNVGAADLCCAYAAERGKKDPPEPPRSAHLPAEARRGLRISERRGRNAANDRDCALVRPVRMVAGG